MFHILLLCVFLFVLKVANASGSGVCAGLHDTAAICRSPKVGSKHFSSGDVYKL